MAVSGVFSVIEVAGNEVVATRGWKVGLFDNGKPIFHSGTNAGAQRITGVTDWTGLFQGYGAVPPIFPGETFKFQGQYDSVNDDTSGVGSGADEAICDRIEVTWRGEEGGVVNYAAFFSANGTLDLDATVADMSEDTAWALPPTAVEMTLVGPTPVAALRSMKLVIRAANRKWSAADTSGGTRRTPGNIDGGCVYSAYVSASDLTAMEAALDTSVAFRLNYSATESWLINWMRIMKVADIGGHRETAENVFITVTGEFNLNSGTALGVIGSGTSGTGKEHWPTNWPAALG